MIKEPSPRFKCSSVTEKEPALLALLAPDIFSITRHVLPETWRVFGKAWRDFGKAWRFSFVPRPGTMLKWQRCGQTYGAAHKTSPGASAGAGSVQVP